MLVLKMQQVKKWLEITNCFVFNYMKSKIPGGEDQSPMGEMMKLHAYPKICFIQYVWLQ